ncbi:MAG: Gfo/Idh/MocA family oxidoreductase [Pirellulaceae bacterium]|nr:Gfo/Idh/MocA family oxidoreductase [Pirellulaceae bacterium]
MIRIGIVGCGRILAAHLRGYQLMRAAGIDDFRITALCARRTDDAWSYVKRGEGPAQRQPVGTGPNDPLAIGDLYLSDFQDDVEVQVFSDYREMIKAGPIDAVNDLTVHTLHHQVAAVAFAAGKDLLTQKPLAVTVAAARRMCERAEADDRVLGVFENARNRADTRQLGWLFRNGWCGDLQMILMTNVGNWWGPDRIVAETPWRHRRTEGGGLALDIGVHLFNHIRHVAGEIATVSARASILEPVRFTRDATGKVTDHVDCDADDTMLASFTTGHGVLGSITASWGGHGAPTLCGTGRGIVYHGSTGSVHGDVVTTDDGLARDLTTLYETECPADIRALHFPHGLTDAFALNQCDWLAAIRARREPETSGLEGLRDLAAAFAVLESSQAGRTVNVEEVASGQLRDFQRPLDERFGLLAET